MSFSVCVWVQSDLAITEGLRIESFCAMAELEWCSGIFDPVKCLWIAEVEPAYIQQNVSSFTWIKDVFSW